MTSPQRKHRIPVSYNLLSAVALLACCGSPSPATPDASAPVLYQVGGRVTGIRGSVTLALNENDTVTVETNGSFAFPRKLPADATYEVSIVSLPDDLRCELDGRSGTIAMTDISSVELSCGIRVGLVRLETSAPTEFNPTFDPFNSQLQLSTSLLTADIVMTPTAANGDSTIQINGVEVASGAPSSPIPLDVGINEVFIQVTAQSGDTRSYVVDVDRGGAAIEQIQVGLPTGPDAQDRFGTSVAQSGDLLAVGTPFEDSGSVGIDGESGDNSAPDSGAVYIFRKAGSRWSQEAYLKASNTDEGDLFGANIAFSGDTLVVAAPGEDSSATGVDGSQADNASPNSGAVYVFRNAGASWNQEAYLKASNTGENDDFGSSVAISGSTLVVGARLEDSSASGVNGEQTSNDSGGSGAAYVFQRTGGVWQQQAYLKASNTGFGDRFGSSVSLFGDTLAVGASGEDSDAVGVNGAETSNAALQSGAVYLFRREGTSWAQEAYLKASNTSEQGLFGAAVALFGDTLAIGAPGEDSNATGIDGSQVDHSAPAAGAVYIFRQADATWSQQAYVKASNTESQDQFGSSLALLSDSLAIGAPGEDSDSDDIDGNQADNSALGSGAVYVFRHADSAWSQEAYLKTTLSTRNGSFGSSVSLSRDALVAGSPGRDRLVSVEGGAGNLIAAGIFNRFE